MTVTRSSASPDAARGPRSYALARVAASPSPSSFLEGELVATNPVVRAPRGTLASSLKCVVRRFQEPGLQDLGAFSALWTEVTGQIVTPRMHGTLTAILRVHGPRAGDVLRARFAVQGTVTNLLVAMLAPEAGASENVLAEDPADALQPLPPLSGAWAIDEILAVLPDLGVGVAVAVSAPPPFLGTAVRGEIEWRVAAMRPQLREHGPIPLLRARPDRTFARRDACVSCGEPSGQARCPACNEAARIVLGMNA